MQDKNEKQTLENQKAIYGTLGFLSTSLALYGLLRKGNYRVAFLLYQKTGGGGLNLYKEQANGNLQRRFAIDYHPFWDHKNKEYAWKLHYHRGDNSNQMKKHRPYQGGW